MASAGINLSITGDSSGFTDAAQEAAKTAETTAREIAETSKRQAEADRRAYDEAMSDLRRRTTARINAAKDIQRAEAAASRAATEASTRNTAESRAAAAAKGAEAAAARRAAEAATLHQRTAMDTARASRQAMRDSASEASRAAEAHLRASQTLARAQAAGRRIPGGAGAGLPGGRGAGGGGVAGAVGRIVSGAAGGAGHGGGGTGGGGRALGSAGEATEVIEGIISGGAVEVVKNGDKIVDLVKTYGAVVARGTGVATAVIGTGVAIGYAIGDWDGFKDSAKRLTDKVDDFIKALKPSEIAKSIVGIISGANALTAQADKMAKDFEKYQAAARPEMARRAGAAEGSNAEALGRAQQGGIQSRKDTFDRTIAEREGLLELQKIKLDGLQSEEAKVRQLADIEKKWLQEKARLSKDHADYEYQRAVQEHAEAKKKLDELNDLERKNRMAAGATGASNEVLERVKAARGGIESRYGTARSALESAAKAVADANSQQTGANIQSKIIDQRQANAEADREAERARQSSALKVKQFWQKIGDVTAQGIENAKLTAQRAASKKEADQNLEELELRARGRHRKADKLKKEREIQREASEYQARDPNITNEQARAFAERQYDATHSNGRIRGAGYRSGREPAPAFGLDNPGFTPGRMGVRPSEPPAFTGLDALNEMQKRNRRIRGAGNKGDSGPSMDSQPQERPVGTSSASGAIATAILSTLSSMNRKLDYLSPARQPSRH